MNVEVRQSFEKDALKLPLKIQREIADIVVVIEAARKLSEIKSCKN